MFTNLIESQSHRKEFRRRSSFFLFTVAAYVVILFSAGIGSIYAYDAQLDAQASDLELMSWVPPVTPVAPKPVTDPARSRRPAVSTAPVDRNVTQSVRTDAIARPDDPTKVPDKIGTEASKIPPVTGHFVIGDRNVDPPVASNNDSSTCTNCSGTSTTVVLPEKAPEPPVVKPPTTLRVPSTILSGKAVNLPQPPYPKIAKDAGIFQRVFEVAMYQHDRSEHDRQKSRTGENHHIGFETREVRVEQRLAKSLDSVAGWHKPTRNLQPVRKKRHGRESATEEEKVDRCVQSGHRHQPCVTKRHAEQCSEPHGHQRHREEKGHQRNRVRSGRYRKNPSARAAE